MNLSEKIQALLSEGTEGKLKDSFAGGSDAAADTAKIKAGQSKKSDEDTTITDPAKEAKADPAAEADNTKIKAGQSKKSSEPTKLKEHMEALFDGEDLSEAFQEKALTIFEAAVEFASEEKIQEAADKYHTQLSEAIEEVKGELVEQIDGYLNDIVESWHKDNAVALESGLKIEMMESFMSGMKDLFESHYVEIPEDKLDVVQEQAETIDAMKLQLEALQKTTDKALAETTMIKCNATVAKLSEGLTVVDSEKLAALAEGVEFSSDEEFATKVHALKESYFRKDSKDAKTEIVEQSQEKQTVVESHGEVEAVLKAMQQKRINLF
jgi:hypothetical protein